MSDIFKESEYQMYLINKLIYEKQNNQWEHVSTRVIRTFSEEKHARAYLENCYKLSVLLPHGKEHYEMEKI